MDTNFRSKRETIIKNYVAGYNSYNVDQMITDLDPGIFFENYENGELNLSITGLHAFKNLAEQTKMYFLDRNQTIESFKHYDDVVEIKIHYVATLGRDFENGLRKGQRLQLKGKTRFEFRNNTIIRITDIS